MKKDIHSSQTAAFLLRSNQYRNVNLAFLNQIAQCTDLKLPTMQFAVES